MNYLKQQNLPISQVSVEFVLSEYRLLYPVDNAARFPL